MNYPQTILLTDDEAHIRKYIGLVLKKFANPRLVEASDGVQAIQLYKQNHPDLVLLDVNMPNMDGVHALEEIKRYDPDAVVIMLTSLANRQTIEECLRLGAVAYIRKDTAREELTAQFERIFAECYDQEVPT